MVCEKCNHILTGSESFCPSCGIICEKVKDDKYNEPASPSVIFSSDSSSAEASSAIFSDEVPVYAHAKEQKKSRNAASLFVAVLCFVLIATVAVIAADYFDVMPTLSSLFAPVGSAETTNSPTTSLSDYNSASGTLAPKLSFRTTVCYLSGSQGQALRKGPDDSYGQIEVLPVGTDLHVVGAMSEEMLWVYVYVPERDIYGWLSSSYISDYPASEEIEEPADELTTEKAPETTGDESTTQAPETTAAAKVSDTSQSYTAKVTAEKGVYLREGPGTTFTPITTFAKDETVTVLGQDEENSGWLLVEAKGYSGYISGLYLSEK